VKIKKKCLLNPKKNGGFRNFVLNIFFFFLTKKIFKNPPAVFWINFKKKRGCKKGGKIFVIFGGKKKALKLKLVPF